MARGKSRNLYFKLFLIYADGAFESLISNGAFFAFSNFLGFLLDASLFTALVLGQILVSSSIRNMK